MKKTNIDLVKYCENALNEKWFYAWGAHGQKASKKLVDSLVKKYPIVNTKWKSYMDKAVENKNNLSDCYGLVKGYLFLGEDNKIVYNAKLDVTSGVAFNRANENNVLNSMPEIPGIILYMTGHVGVYAGNGRFIECAGGGVGMAEGEIKDGKVIKSSKFTHWFKDINIEYLEEKPIVEEPQVMPEKPKNPLTESLVTLIIDKSEIQVKGGLIEDNNYVMLRDIADVLGYIVDWTEEERIPILTKK